MKRLSRTFGLLALAAGLMLFLYLVTRAGVGTIEEKFAALGWGMAALIALSGAREGLRAVAWRQCLEAAEPRPGLARLLGLRLMGNAYTDITPAGPLLGESVKVWAGASSMPASSSAASVTIENLVYSAAAALFVFGGMALLVFAIVAPRRLQIAAYGAGGLLLAAMVGLTWALRRREPVVGTALDWLQARGLRWTLIARHEQGIRNFGEKVHAFFRTRRAVFLRVLALEAAANLTGVGEAYVILRAAAGHASWLAAYLAEAATRVAHLAFFIPLGLGTEEAAAGATLAALGYSLSTGVSLAVIRKGRTLFWDAAGLLFAARRAIWRPTVQPPEGGLSASHETLDCECG